MIQTEESSRISIRLPCQFPAEIKFLGGGTEQIKKALISNISTTGVQILSPSFIATGQKIQTGFKIPGKSTLNLDVEVMRVESLLGRMIGHYPYALGARFVNPGTKQEKKITQFIQNKTTCLSQRIPVGVVLLCLGALELAQFFVPALNFHPQLTQTFSPKMLLNWIDTIAAFGLAAGLTMTSVLCFLNQKRFISLGKFFLGTEIIAAAFRLFAFHGLLAWQTNNSFFWLGDIVVISLSGLLILAISGISTQLKEMELRLTAEKISPGPNKPTFTIL